jgi:hypothetical protein
LLDREDGQHRVSDEGEHLAARGVAGRAEHSK